MVPISGWNSYEWDEHHRTLLRLHAGMGLVPCKDKAGGDRGLTDHVGAVATRHAFAPQGEPRTPTTGNARQRGAGAAAVLAVLARVEAV